MKDGIYLPKDIAWSKEDWKDLSDTLSAFAERVRKRHGIKEPCPVCQGRMKAMTCEYCTPMPRSERNG